MSYFIKFDLCILLTKMYVTTTSISRNTYKMNILAKKYFDF